MSYAPRNETSYQRSSPSDYTSKSENPGPIPSDSLAAESLQQNGSFGNSSSSSDDLSTSNNNNNNNNKATTSQLASATILDPAPDREARLASEAWSETSQLNAGRSLGYQDSGRGPTYNIPKSTDGIEPPRPKGKDLTEGGFFSGEEANASFGTVDIGGKRDPGRVAVGEMEERNARVSGGGVAGRQGSGEEEGRGFERLGGDTEA